MFGYRHGKGAIVLGGSWKAETLQCVHCGMHWEPKPGSGTRRGFCTSCRGVTCGKEKCDPCIPHEAQIEFIEALSEGDIKKQIQLIGEFPLIKNYII